jgi:hypothetical protein
VPERRNLAAVEPTRGQTRVARTRGTGLRARLAETAEQVKKDPPPVAVRLRLTPDERRRLAELRWLEQKTTGEIVAELLRARLREQP